MAGNLGAGGDGRANGRNATPAASAENPSTVWTKIDVRKTAPTRMPDIPSMTVVPETRVRILQVCTGISGRAARRSTAAKAVSRAAEIASVTRVRADVHP